ncbi:hypothetical protein Anas_02242 [Armadillidium nasatum]|uniref:Uncharacterized protein n=1 Tax=Armadillidium nasatum TaxID=96803 RepID=A0A5N5T066_9CRUS|nr:hypothetical protein Anas_02242 [Armadillidium nasatum]
MVVSEIDVEPEPDSTEEEVPEDTPELEELSPPSVTLPLIDYEVKQSLCSMVVSEIDVEPEPDSTEVEVPEDPPELEELSPPSVTLPLLDVWEDDDEEEEDSDPSSVLLPPSPEYEVKQSLWSIVVSEIDVEPEPDSPEVTLPLLDVWEDDDDDDEEEMEEDDEVWEDEPSVIWLPAMALELDPPSEILSVVSEIEVEPEPDSTEDEVPEDTPELEELSPPSVTLPLLDVWEDDDDEEEDESDPSPVLLPPSSEVIAY